MTMSWALAAVTPMRRELERFLAGGGERRGNRQEEREARGGVAAEAQEHPEADRRPRARDAWNQRTRLGAPDEHRLEPRHRIFGPAARAEPLGAEHHDRPDRQRPRGDARRPQRLLDVVVEQQADDDDRHVADDDALR